MREEQNHQPEEGVERYGTINAWARELDVHISAIEKRLKGWAGITGKNASGRIIENGFFGEVTMHDRCAELFMDLPQANETRFFTKKNTNGIEEKHGTFYAWSKVLPISESSIRRKLKNIAGIKGKSVGGQIVICYAESIVRTACTDLLSELKQADDSGFLLLQNGDKFMRYATIAKWAKEFNISTSTLHSRLRKYKGVTAKDSGGRIQENRFFSEEQVHDVLNIPLKNCPQASKEGFFEMEGNLYGTVLAWSRKLSLSRDVIKARVNASEEGITGKTYTGRLAKNAFLSESIVTSRCSELLNRHDPVADRSGFFYENNGIKEKYGTVEAWSRELKLPRTAIRKRVTKLTGAGGIDAKGQMRRESFYSESQVREVCSNILSEYPLVNEKGFFSIEGERYATAKKWSEEFGLDRGTVVVRLKRKEGKNGRTVNGKLLKGKFFSETAIRETCTGMTQQCPIADDSGFLSIDLKGTTVRYGTLARWSDELGISQMAIKKRTKTEGITGRTHNNKIIPNGFYPEPTILSACEDLLQQVPQAEENGFFSLNGSKFATIRTWARKLDTPESALRAGLKKTRGITGKTFGGKIVENAFFGESIVQTYCKQTLVEHPRASASGFFELYGKRYGTIPAWAKEIPFDALTIRRRIGTIRGITGKLSTGKTIENGFYDEDTIRSKCEDMLRSYPRANQDGFFFAINSEQKSERYGTIPAWARELTVSTIPIRSRLEKLGTAGIAGRTSKGKILKNGFYSETVIRSCCADLLQNFPQADDSSFFSIKGERHGTISAWARELSLGDKQVRSRLGKLQSMMGKDSKGRVLDFYPETSVRAACSILLGPPLPVADESGFISLAAAHCQRERFGTTKAWARELPISESVIIKRLRKGNVQGIAGQLRGGQVTEKGFFAESAVRSACANLLKLVSQADETGFFWIQTTDGNAQRYATKFRWSQELKLSELSVSRRLKDVPGTTGKDSSGHILENGFYAEQDVLRACAALLVAMPQVDPDNFFLLQGEKYATVHKWADFFSVAPQTVRKYLLERKIDGITGKDASGHIIEKGFFAESAVRSACAHLLFKP